MPLGLATRELELIIIASDQASSTLARVGGGLTLLGAGMTRLSVEAFQAFGTMTGEALDFDRQARLAFTQVADKAETTLDDVKNVLINVASTVGRPIEELQEAIFDIFSSIDANAETAEFALQRVGQAAVAGQTDVRSALIPSIAVLNAYQRPLEDIDNILDIQFKTVERGIITYDELTANIGKSIPAARAAGQDFETLGGIIAFLTRNGLNAAMASTSAARALELFADPKNTKRLEDAGIAVRTEAGEFRQINEVLTDLQTIFGDLTGPERKEKFKELFGTGRIQARRFFDIAIPNFDELNSLINDFQGSSGAMQAAYDVMFEAPISKLDVFRNRWELLRIEIGNRFIPILEDRLLPLLDNLFDRWDGLSEQQKDAIVEFATMAAAGTGVAGVLTTMAGVGILLKAIWAPFLKVLKPVAIGLGRATPIIAAVAAAGWLLWKNWDKVRPVFEKVGDAVKDAWDYLQPFIADVKIFAREQWDKFIDRVRKAWEKLGPVIAEVAQFVRERWMGVVDWWTNDAWPKIADVVNTATELIKVIIETALNFIATIIEGAVEVYTWLWENFGETIRAIWKTAWDLVTQILSSALDVLKGLMEVFIGILTGDFERIKEGLGVIWQGLWDFIYQVGEEALDLLAALFADLKDLIMPHWEETWNAVDSFFRDKWTSLTQWFQDEIWNNGFVVFIRESLGLIYEVMRIFLVGADLLWRQFWGNFSEDSNSLWSTIVEDFKVQFAPLIDFWDWFWNDIKTFFTNMWSQEILPYAKQSWQELVDIFNVVDDINQALINLKNIVSNKLQELFGVVGDWVGKIRDKLSKLDPREWFSPPITNQVADGLSALGQVMAAGLGGIGTVVPDRVEQIRNSLLGMLPDDSEFFGKADAYKSSLLGFLAEMQAMELGPVAQFGFGSASVDDILRAKAFGESSGPVGVDQRGLETPQTVVNIDTMNNNADPTEIAREIAWEVITSRGGQ